MSNSEINPHPRLSYFQETVTCSEQLPHGRQCKSGTVWPWFRYQVTEEAFSQALGYLPKALKLDEGTLLPQAPTKVQEASHTVWWDWEARREGREETLCLTITKVGLSWLGHFLRVPVPRSKGLCCPERRGPHIPRAANISSPIYWTENMKEDNKIKQFLIKFL